MISQQRATRTVPMTLALAASLAMLVGAPAYASTFSYDFEILASGALVGQDGWSQVANWFSPEVASGGGINQTKASGRPNSAQGSGTGAIRSLETTLTYSAADTAVPWQFDGLVIGTDVSQTALMGVGSRLFGRQGTRTLLILDTPLFGDTLLANDWYQYRMELNFSVAGVNSTLFYRNLTAGEADFTSDSILHDINLGLTPNGLGEYQFASVFIRQDTNVGGTYVDNIQISPVPAPPALALLGTGVALIAARTARRRVTGGFAKT
jgi:hypothetical protein